MNSRILALITLLLTALSLVFIYFTYNISKEQLILVKKQTNIAEVSILPKIEIQIISRANEENIVFDEDILEIRNIGGHLNDLSIEMAIFLSTAITFDATTDLFNAKRVLIPIDGYYYIRTFKQNPTGVIAILERHNNDLMIKQLNEMLFSYLQSIGGRGSVYIFRCLKLHYIDKLGNPHLEYYLPSSLATINIIHREGEKYFSYEDKMIHKGFYFNLYNVMPDALLNVWKVIEKEGGHLPAPLYK